MLCRSIAQSGFDNIVNLMQGAQMAEIRLEVSGLDAPQVRELFKQHPNLLATCRPENLTDAQRTELLKAAIEGGAKWVDIEIESSFGFTTSLMAFAKKHHCKVIISYHNYDLTPDAGQLADIVKEAVQRGAELVKVATMVKQTRDNAHLLGLYNYGFPMLALGMGPLGAITRVAALKLGAPFTFVSAPGTEGTAPGQLSENVMFDILKHL